MVIRDQVVCSTAGCAGLRLPAVAVRNRPRFTQYSLHPSARDQRERQRVVLRRGPGLDDLRRRLRGLGGEEALLSARMR